jgi:hypothetical protein
MIFDSTRDNTQDARGFVAIVIRNYFEMRFDSAGINKNQADRAIVGLIMNSDFRSSIAMLDLEIDIVAKISIKSIPTQYPKIVYTSVGARIPAIAKMVAGLDRIAARIAVEVQAIIDMKDCP